MQILLTISVLSGLIVVLTYPRPPWWAPIALITATTAAALVFIWS